MKNFIGAVAFVMCFSLNLNATTTVAKKQINCIALTFAVFDAYYEAGYSYYESYQASNWAYEGCVSNGGFPGN